MNDGRDGRMEEAGRFSEAARKAQGKFGKSDGLPLKCLLSTEAGSVAEWLNALVLKTSDG